MLVYLASLLGFIPSVEIHKQKVVMLYDIIPCLDMDSPIAQGVLLKHGFTVDQLKSMEISYFIEQFLKSKNVSTSVEVVEACLSEIHEKYCVT